MLDQENIRWPRALFWFLVSVLVGLLVYKVKLVTDEWQPSSLEILLFSALELLLTLLVGWKIASASAEQKVREERQQFMASSLGRFQEVKRSVERLQVLINMKRQAAEEQKLLDKAGTPLLREFFEHIYSVTDEIRGSLVAGIESFNGMTDREITRQQVVSQLESEISDLKNQLLQARLAVNSGTTEERARLIALYEEERKRLQTQLESLQELFSQGGLSDPITSRLLRGGTVRRHRWLGLEGSPQNGHPNGHPNGETHRPLNPSP